MSAYLGTIRSISTRSAILDLHVFDDGLVVARGSAKGLAARVAGQVALGNRGFRLADAAASEREAAADAGRMTVTAADLVAESPSNRFIPFDEVSAVHLSHPWFPPIYRLDLELVDGGRERFEWKRLSNEPKAVAELLARAVGSKLTTHRI